MKASIPLSLLFGTGILVACEKTMDLNAVDLEVSATITNTVSGNGLAQPYAKKSLFVTEDPNLDSYLFSATTNDDGIAVFEGLNAQKTYYVFAYERPADGGLQFFDSVKVQASVGMEVVVLDLRPSATGQNGFLLTLSDAAGLPLANVNACVTTNPGTVVLAGCSSAVASGSTDAYGRISKLNVGAGTYFARFTNAALFLDTVVSFSVTANAIAELSYTLNTGTPTGLRLFCTDGNNAAIPAVAICGYANEQVANAGDCGLSTFQGVSGIDGRYLATGMPAGRYYVHLAIDSLSIDTLLPYDIQQGEVLQATVVLL